MFRWLILLIALSACTPRPVLVAMPDGETAEKVTTVFTATNRLPDGRMLAGGRSEDLSFTQLDIAVPPNRATGEITTPKRRAPNPDTDFLLNRPAEFQTKDQFAKALRAEIRAHPSDKRDILIFVHGFNYTFSQGVLRMAQLTTDLDLNAVSIHFSWPSAANPLGYQRDRGSALFSRDQLEDLIDVANQSGARRVIVVAHSMGAFLAMETLRQMAIAKPGSVTKKVHGVVLISPDIDVSVFRTQARRIGKLPDIFAIFVSDEDRALRLSARLTGERERLGNLTDASAISDLRVALVNVSQFANGQGTGHFVPGTSPELIEILSRAADVENAFGSDASSRPGLLPGSVLTIQNVTQFVLTPPIEAIGR
jgi:esterase/lipase superfamily enzyme